VVKPCKRWFYVVAGPVAAFVAISSIVAAISEGSWSPVVSAGWLPAVIVASGSGTCRRGSRGRRGPVG
jgi:hypothetical protein